MFLKYSKHVYQMSRGIRCELIYSDDDVSITYFNDNNDRPLLCHTLRVNKTLRPEDYAKMYWRSVCIQFLMEQSYKESLLCG